MYKVNIKNIYTGQEFESNHTGKANSITWDMLEEDYRPKRKHAKIAFLTAIQVHFGKNCRVMVDLHSGTGTVLNDSLDANVVATISYSIEEVL